MFFPRVTVPPPTPPGPPLKTIQQYEQSVQAGLPLDELSSRKTDYADGARLGPLFGRKGKVSRRGNNHALKVCYCYCDTRGCA